MDKKLQAIAEAFSNGQFDQTYPCLAADIVWTVVGEETFRGKEAVMANCEHTAAYFRSVTTHFKTIHVIAGGNCIAISGTAEFLCNNKRVAFVQACDVYEFTKTGELKAITSYCIPDKA